MTNASDDAVLAELLEVDGQRAQAQFAGDWDTLDGLLHEKFIFVHSDGKTQDKQAYLEGSQKSFVGSKGPRLATRSNVQVRSFGSYATLTGWVAFGGSPDRQVMQLWVNEGGKWLLAASQTTKIHDKYFTDPTQLVGK